MRARRRPRGVRRWLHSGDGPRVGLCPGTAPQEAGAAPGPARGSGAGVTAGRCFFLVPSSELRFAIRFCSTPSPAAPQIIKPEIILIGSRIHKGFFFLCLSAPAGAGSWTNFSGVVAAIRAGARLECLRIICCCVCLQYGRV